MVSSLVPINRLRLCRQSYRSFKHGVFRGLVVLRKAVGIKFFRDYVEEVTEAWWGGVHEDSCRNNLSVCVDTVFRHKDDEGVLRCCPYWHRRLTNKLTGREFALRYGVPVPTLYWAGKSVDEIPFQRLPSDFVIKTSFGASGKQVLVVQGWRNLFTGNPLTVKDVKEFFRGIMDKPAPFGYLLVEELLSANSEGGFPYDYKCHVFNGRVEFVQVNDKLRKELTWYTRDWRAPCFDLGTGKLARGLRRERPEGLDALIEYAERLGRAYGPYYVRIDFLGTNRGWVFGEFTATPSKGKGRSLYGNYILGRLWGATVREQQGGS